MINAEKYKNTIRSLLECSDYFGVVDDQPVCCRHISCENCEFNTRDYCVDGFVSWLMRDYKEA